MGTRTIIMSTVIKPMLGTKTTPIIMDRRVGRCRHRLVISCLRCRLVGLKRLPAEPLGISEYLFEPLGDDLAAILLPLRRPGP